MLSIAVYANEDIIFVTNLGLPGIYISNIDVSGNTALNFTIAVQNDLLTRPVALDFDATTSTLYWSDVATSSIESYSIATNQHTVLVSFESGSVDGLVVDGNGNKLYWTSTAEDRIEVINLDGTDRTILFDSALVEPRAIKIDTENGYLYWTDWGTYMIERAQLNDLSTRTALVTTGLIYPNGLVLSVSEGKMYWCDAGTGQIEESNLDGTSRRTIIYVVGKYPFGIEIYGNYLYWSDWTSGIYRVDKQTGISSMQSSDSRLNKPGGLLIFTDSTTEVQTETSLTTTENVIAYEDCFATEGDPCHSELELTDWYRSIHHDTQPGFIISDNYIRDGWYNLRNEGDRIDIRMPTSPPGNFKCGTKYPVWINGTYPENGDPIQNVTGCVDFNGTVCAYSMAICIKACPTEDGQYFVHYLTDTPEPYMGYCTDSLLPCDGNLTSSTGFPPCDDNFPTFNEEPVLIFEAEEIGISAVCNINTTESFNDIDYYVRWFINETMAYEQKNQHKISDEYDVDASDPKKCSGGGEPHQCILNSKLGSYVQCEVSLKFTDQHVFSPRVRSNTFYAGLTVEPNNTIEFDIGANNGIEFNISSTIPIVPNSQLFRMIFANQELELNIDVDIDGNYAYSDKSCKKRLSNVSPATFNIIAAKTWFKYANKANYIRFKGDLTFDTILSRIWKSRQTSLPTFKIIANGVNVKSCSGSGDPHYRSFDGWYYHIYGTGDFIFYEHTTLPIKVQTRLSTCNGVTCTCGVAVQVGHTHLIVDRCNDAGNTYTIFKATHDGVVKEVRTPTNTKVTTAEILKDGERTPGTSLEYKNRHFKINLPTGSYITIKLFWSRYVSVFMTGSWDDFENIKGLCGNFDNKLHNDGQYGNSSVPDYKCVKPEDCKPAYYNTVDPKNFYNSWRVKNNENIFLGALNVDNPYVIQRYCSCEEGNIKCDHCNGLNANNNNLGCGSDDDEETNGVRRRKREVEVNDLDDQAGNYEFTPFDGDPDFEPQIPEFPTPNGLTEEYTTKICTETLLNSTTYEVCLDAINNGSITIDDIIEGCIVDIMVADDESIAKQTVTELQDRCELELTTNPQYWEVSENGTLVPPTELLGQLCVNECSDKGECINGTCACIEGFGGSDCSISLAEPPLVFAVLGDGLCDIRSRPCRSAKVYGENFDERGNITCHIQHINVSGIGVTLLQETSIVSGIFRTDQEVKCPLPEPAVQPGSPGGEGVVASGYLISISNDGELKSEEMAVLIVYDSVCQVCNASEGECYLKNNSCNIDGHCYAAFDVNTEDCCQQCLPEDSVDSWLPRKDDAAPIIYTSNPYTAIHQEPITFTFDIQDPEGCGITFNKTYGNVNATISTSGKFNWAPAMSNPDSIFEINMQDKCGFSATFNFSVYVCKCENGDVCAFVNGSSLYECVASETSEETPITEGTHLTSLKTENTIMSTANVNDPVSTPTHIVSESSPPSSSSITESTYADVTFLEKGTMHSTYTATNERSTSLTDTLQTDFTVSNSAVHLSKHTTTNSDDENGDGTQQTTIRETKRTTLATTDVLDVSISSTDDNKGKTIEKTILSQTSTNTDTPATLNIMDLSSNDGTEKPTISETETQDTIATSTSDEGNGKQTRQTTIQEIDTSTQPSITSRKIDGDTSKQTTVTEVNVPDRETTISTVMTSKSKTTTSNVMASHDFKTVGNTDASTGTQTQHIIATSTSGEGKGKQTRQTTIQVKDTSTQPSITSRSIGGDTSKQTTVTEVNVPERETTVSTVMTSKSKITTSNVMASHDFKTVGNTDASTGTKATERLTSQGTQYYTSSPNPSSSSSPVLTTHTKSTSGYSTNSVRTNSYDEPTVLQDDRTELHGLTTLGSDIDFVTKISQSSTINDVTSVKNGKYMTSFKSTPQTYISSEEPRTNEHILTEPVTETEIKLTKLSNTVDNYNEAVSLTLKGHEVPWLPTVKEVFRISVMHAMNTYCLINAASCCDWTETNTKNTLNEDITTIGQIKLTDEKIANNQIDIVMSVGYKNYSNTCFQNNGERQKRDSTNNKKHSISRRNNVANEYISAEVVKSAIEQEKESIEAAIQMEIIDVSLYSEEKEPVDDKSYTVFILIGVCCFTVIILFGFAFGVYKWLHRPNKSNYTSSKIVSIPSSSPSPTSLSTDVSGPSAISSSSLDGMFIASSLKGSRAGTPTSINAWN
ncbi:uncharacterized protein [Antedon mediterranea]|uniref:uncharacterized protein n=1 Tax=Antedon mediterranea TaxID=105859 RepID=UPI003AF7BF20